MEECRRYADAANWKEFTYSMGGPVCPRDARPVRLHHLLDPATNKYGEEVIRLVGLAAGGTIKKTRLDGWVLRSKATDKPAEPTVEGLSERSEAGFGEHNEVLSSGASCDLWSSGNNCTTAEIAFLGRLHESRHQNIERSKLISEWSCDKNIACRCVAKR